MRLAPSQHGPQGAAHLHVRSASWLLIVGALLWAGIVATAAVLVLHR